MPRSVRVHPNHRVAVALALERNGFLTQGDLARHLEMALSTVNNFCRCVNVSVAKFEDICEALGLDARSLLQPTVSVSKSVTTAPTQVLQSEETAIDRFFAYDRAWVGRAGLLQSLAEKLQGTDRLLLITGIAGVGKTALAERLVIELQANQRLIRSNFDNQEQAVDFGSVAARLLEKCGQPITAHERQNPQQLGWRLFKQLQEQPYLLLIDSLEELLIGGDRSESEFQDQGYLTFFQQLLAAEEFQSRIVITSQELPVRLLELGTRYQKFWHCQPLTGLTTTEQQTLFERMGFDMQPASSDRPYLMRIGQAYEGHPLALRVIGGEIGSRPFFGSVVAYWNRYGNEIEQVEQAIAAATAGAITGADDKWALDRFTRTLRRNVRKRLEQSFQRLQQDAYNAYVLLCEASVYRCPVPEDWWLSHLEYLDLEADAEIAAMDALRDRYLVDEVLENNQYLLKQHNLIRSLALEHLDKLDDN
ncbi:MAG: ATP-binding protein [Cyanothece sp. SIO1E1]|nr:ATP-binding protein [Cyanothece sp. SIO1E1]